jgi:hypothetical protein
MECPQETIFPALPGPPPNAKTASLGFQFRAELDQANALRYTLDEQAAKVMGSNLGAYRKEFSKWLKNLQDTKQNLEPEEASWLTSFLAVDPNFADPDHYKCSILFDNQQYTFTITGRNSRPWAETATQIQPGVRNVDHLSFAKPVDFAAPRLTEF